MENLDLNLNNYNFDELRDLFGLTDDFNMTGLKRAYKMVLMTHPDKSGLDKEYFYFLAKHIS